MEFSYAGLFDCFIETLLNNKTKYYENQEMTTKTSTNICLEFPSLGQPEKYVQLTAHKSLTKQMLTITACHIG